MGCILSIYTSLKVTINASYIDQESSASIIESQAIEIIEIPNTVKALQKKYNVNDDISELLYRKSIKYSMDVELLFAICFVESSFNPYATSGKRAFGLFQITEIAEIEVNRVYNLSLDRYDMEDNIAIGILFLQYLFTKMEFEDAIKHYNGGTKYRNQPSVAKYYRKINREFYKNKIITKNI